MSTIYFIDSTHRFDGVAARTLRTALYSCADRRLSGVGSARHWREVQTQHRVSRSNWADRVWVFEGRQGWHAQHRKPASACAGSRRGSVGGVEKSREGRCRCAYRRSVRSATRGRCARARIREANDESTTAKPRGAEAPRRIARVPRLSASAISVRQCACWRRGGRATYAIQARRSREVRRRE